MRRGNLTRRDFLKVSGTGVASVMISGCGAKFLGGQQGHFDTIPFRTIDLNKGEKAKLELDDDSLVNLQLLDVQHKQDSVCGAVREVRLQVKVDGETVELPSGNYTLPVAAGKFKLDCPVTYGYYAASDLDRWGLVKHARLRVWHRESAILPAGTFLYPVKLRWSASDTQMSNEPVYVDGSEQPGLRKIFYHSALDFGGAERLVEVVSATDGLVVSRGTNVLDAHKNKPIMPRYDVVYVLDERGWYIRYSHLYQIDEAIRTGGHIGAGQRIGLVGKEGSSGGWSHLHFEITSMQPSGKWGTQDAYPFVWEAYRREYQPMMMAVARPHKVVRVGEEVVLDGSRSWGAGGQLSYQWLLSDGTKSSGATVKKIYAEPGTFCETLQISDHNGNSDYDFCKVIVFGGANAEAVPPSIHACCFPTQNVKVGQRITFKVRSFTKEQTGETMDFGDESKAVTVYSDGNRKRWAGDGYAVTDHVYDKPGDYIVRAECRDKAGHIGETRLLVRVSV